MRAFATGGRSEMDGGAKLHPGKLPFPSPVGGLSQSNPEMIKPPS